MPETTTPCYHACEGPALYMADYYLLGLVAPICGECFEERRKDTGVSFRRIA